MSPSVLSTGEVVLLSYTERKDQSEFPTALSIHATSADRRQLSAEYFWSPRLHASETLDSPASSRKTSMSHPMALYLLGHVAYVWIVRADDVGSKRVQIK